ncbi:hypothetical protein Bphyt_7385 (plasmid) [Paraburkholderia phytofirmans PsJN]|uniref:Uncharacterized protein n=1 Tax=Paraburkholderia phytofirmans (strain DSM 17436 / LMG 22146 / PsJN) TaxID=398527 RepID=B2TGV4_PARPJ|nr:hypothetical protein Bphyt_7385 [Paraburkholderia phytofirmans PsJN]
MASKSIYFGKRATVDQMTEARMLCRQDPVLTEKLDNLLSKRPNERIMFKFIDYLRDPNRHKGRFAVGLNTRKTDSHESERKRIACRHASI